MVGEASPHIFTQPRWAYGAQFRYKFDARWALSVHGMEHAIYRPETEAYVSAGKYTTIPDSMMHMVNVDVVAEFNFLRLGLTQYDSRYCPVSPYIFLGVGCGIYNGPGGQGHLKAAAYIPFGIGVKWKMARRFSMNLAWQHNLYFADDLERHALLGNTWQLNGSNIFNGDLTSQITLGLVFEFAQQRKICKFCEQ